MLMVMMASRANGAVVTPGNSWWGGDTRNSWCYISHSRSEPTTTAAVTEPTTTAAVTSSRLSHSSSSSRLSHSSSSSRLSHSRSS